MAQLLARWFSFLQWPPLVLQESGPKSIYSIDHNTEIKSLPGRVYSQHDVTPRHMLYLSSFWLADMFWLHHVSYKGMMGSGPTAHAQRAAYRSNQEVKTDRWNKHLARMYPFMTSQRDDFQNACMIVESEWRFKNNLSTALPSLLQERCLPATC